MIKKSLQMQYSLGLFQSLLFTVLNCRKLHWLFQRQFFNFSFYVPHIFVICFLPNKYYFLNSAFESTFILRVCVNNCLNILFFKVTHNVLSVGTLLILFSDPPSILAQTCNITSSANVEKVSLSIFLTANADRRAVRFTLAE